MQTMESIFTNLKNTFRAGNILAKLIYINVGLFILIRLMGVALQHSRNILFAIFADAFVARTVIVSALDGYHLYVHSFRLPAYSF